MPRATYRQKFLHRPFSTSPAGPAHGYPARIMTLGVFFIVLGTIGLMMTLLVTLATVIAFGVLIIVGGVAQTVHAFSVPGWKERGGYLVMGLIYLFAGFLVVFNPLAASAAFTFLLAVALVVLGVCRIGFAVRNRGHKKWLWPLVAGNLSILLGIVIMLQWPLAGLWAIGLLLSLEMIFHGWGFLSLPLFDRRAAAKR